MSQAHTAKAQQEEEVLRLNERDAQQFVEALLAPPKPARRALIAARRYFTNVGA